LGINARVQPQLVIGGKIFSNGEDWTSNGPQAGIAWALFFLQSQCARTNRTLAHPSYLQTGACPVNT